MSPYSPKDSQESSPTPQLKSINFSALGFLHCWSQLCFSVFGSGCQPVASALSRVVSCWAPGSPPPATVCLAPLEASREVGSILPQTKPRDSEVLPLALSPLFLNPSLSAFILPSWCGDILRELSSQVQVAQWAPKTSESCFPFHLSAFFSPGIFILDWVQRNAGCWAPGYKWSLPWLSLNPLIQKASLAVRVSRYNLFFQTSDNLTPSAGVGASGDFS